MSLSLTRILCGLVLVIGFSTMAGWLLDQDALSTTTTNFIVMVFNAAVCFVLSAIGLLLSTTKAAYRRQAQIAIGVILMAFAAAVLAQDIFEISLGIDHFFVRVAITDLNPHAGRMAPATTVSFILSGMLLILMNIKTKHVSHILIQAIILCMIGLAVISLTLSTVRLELLYEWYHYSRMALWTATSFLLLSVAFWTAWYQRETQAGGYLQHDDQRITVIGVLLVLIVAITSGTAGFGILAGKIEQILEASLIDTYTNRSEAVQNEIGLAISSSFPITTRLLLNRALIKINLTPTDEGARGLIIEDAQSFLAHNFTGVAIYSKSGERVASLGAFIKDAALDTTLHTSGDGLKVNLLWGHGAYLHLTMNILYHDEIIGVAEVERRLPHLEKLVLEKDSLGESAETRICHAIDDKTMHCLPSTRHPDPFDIESRFYKNNALNMDFALRDITGIRPAYDYRGCKVIAAFGPVADYGLGMVVKVDAAEFYGPIRQKLQYVLMMLGLLSVLGIMLLRLQLIPLVRRLVKSEERIKTIMDNVGEGIITITEDGLIESVNPAICHMFGYQPDELIKKNIQMLMPERMKPSHQKGMNSYMSGGEPHVVGKGAVEVPALRRDGEEFTLLLTVSEVRVEKQRLFIGSMRDISDRKRLEKLKTEFVATVSHELRTPLTSIRGSLGLIIGGAAGVLPETSRHLIGIAYKNAERLILLINDILDVEKIESGQMHFDMAWHTVQSLIEQAVELNRPFSEKYNIAIEISGELTAASIRVDGNRFSQVMSNLLSNAAKFSNAGDVIEVSALQEGDYINIHVTDHGPGIPEEFQQRIFGKFAQADGSDTRAKGGTGLGLNITKHIVERMGGTISFTTDRNQGTTFIVKFPAAPKGGILQPNAGSANKTRILICEDEPDIAESLKRIFAQQGYQADIALDGRQTMSLLQNQQYSLMTLDLILPDCDGIDLIQQIRAEAATANLPIIIISAKAEEGYRLSHGSAINVVDWLPKSIDPRRLISVIQHIQRTHVTHGLAKILHVEDDADIAEIVRLSLHHIAQVVTAKTLAEARTMLAAGPVDLVILDLALPDGSGLELLESLKLSSTQKAPVVIFSASDVLSDIAARVSNVLVKSRTSEDQLVSVILSLLKNPEYKTPGPI